jgi:hypothetical protein
MKQESVNFFVFGSKSAQMTTTNLSREPTCFLIEATIKILGSYGGEHSFGLTSAGM